jgi:hypothetical protein
MKRIRNLRVGAEFAATLRNNNPCGVAPGNAELRSASRRETQQRARFRTTENAEISEILIGSTAIRNRRKSLKAKHGRHF